MRRWYRRATPVATTNPRQFPANAQRDRRRGGGPSSTDASCETHSRGSPSTSAYPRSLPSRRRSTRHSSRRPSRGSLPRSVDRALRCARCARTRTRVIVRSPADDVRASAHAWPRSARSMRRAPPRSARSAPAKGSMSNTRTSKALLFATPTNETVPSRCSTCSCTLGWCPRDGSKPGPAPPARSDTPVRSAASLCRRCRPRRSDSQRTTCFAVRPVGTLAWASFDAAAATTSSPCARSKDDSAPGATSS